jgi:hypothetical protein
MENKRFTDYGIFTQTAGPANSAVTSIQAGDGLTATPNPIVSTGTIGENQSSTCTMINGPQNDVSGAFVVLAMAPVDATLSNYTIENNNRTFFGFSDRNDGIAPAGRFGFGGLAWGDEIALSATIETNCNGGAISLAASFAGTLSGWTSSFSPSSVVTCNGTTQTITFTATTGRIGNLGSSTTMPRSPAQDNFTILGIRVGAPGTGTMGYTNITSSINIYSD